MAYSIGKKKKETEVRRQIDFIKETNLIDLAALGILIGRDITLASDLSEMVNDLLVVALQNDKEFKKDKSRMEYDEKTLLEYVDSALSIEDVLFQKQIKSLFDPKQDKTIANIFEYKPLIDKTTITDEFVSVAAHIQVSSVKEYDVFYKAIEAGRKAHSKSNSMGTTHIEESSNKE